MLDHFDADARVEATLQDIDAADVEVRTGRHVRGRVFFHPMENRGRRIDEPMKLLQQEARTGTQIEETQDRAPAIQDSLPGPAQRNPGCTLDRADTLLFPILFRVVANQRSTVIEHVDDRRIDVDRVATATCEIGMPVDRRIPGAAAGPADRTIDTRHRMLPCVRNSVPDLSREDCNAGAQRRRTSSATARSSSAPCRSSTT